jgi:hypothetical protein
LRLDWVRLLKWAKHCALQPRAVTARPLHRPTLSSLFLRPATSAAKFEVSTGSLFGFLVGALSFAQVDLRAQPPRKQFGNAFVQQSAINPKLKSRNIFTFKSTMPAPKHRPLQQPLTAHALARITIMANTN